MVTTRRQATRAPFAEAGQGAGRANRRLRRVVALAGRILRQVLRDRISLVLLFVVPLFVLTILQLVLSNPTAGVVLGIVPPADPGDAAFVGQLEQRLREQQEQGGLGVVVKSIAPDQVEATLTAGEADGILIFPADFTRDLQAGQTSTLTLRLEGSHPAAAQELRGLVAVLVTSLTQPAGAVGPAPGNPSNPSSPTGLNSPWSVGRPPVLTTTYLYGGPDYTQTDALAPFLIGLFAFMLVFLLTAVAFLRERAQGTMERLLVSPLSKTELVLGYVLGFTLFALAQALLILLFVVAVLRVHSAGNLGLLFLVTLVLTIAGVNMGIFVSAFARTELQVNQFIPLLLVPQVWLGGLFWPVATLPPVLKQLAYAMPLTYANFALTDVMLKGFGLDRIWPELVVLVAFAVLMVLAAARSLRGERA
jgi:ABC-2 type transport system permease protein